ncbi:GAF domain-containing SpoIIE family protein phosphatase [Actinoplanes sp. NPDC051633]|uniref:GAF domain-containing SpoIIE family protein phosphatase n=1 Tax=Actinoplanes sp. NPDC051633 TaxID=3155670 RepID=UPI00343D5EB8
MASVEAMAADERLRRLEAVTDAALGHLDAADLLDELLGRVRDLLEVDTVAVLLLDVRAQQLVATAAKGLEEEVRRGFRLAVGRGFAGRVAASRQPVALHDIRPGDVVNPLLLEAGVRSLLGVPMLAGGELVGVLHVGSRTLREFTDDDVQLLQLVADRAAAAGEIRAHRLDQTAALALQRSLLPATLPVLPGLDLAARFVPGHEFGVGGDWFDVFTLPSGWVGVVVGDVSGHGLQAAVVMGRIRSALRAYALICDDPAEALSMLDRKVRHFEAASLATVLYAMIAPDRGRVLLSLAGHFPPVIAEPGRPAALAEAPVDPPVGIDPARFRRRSTTLPWPADAVLAGFTDGLIERRDRIIDVGIAALIAAVRAGVRAEQVCTDVMTAIDVENPVDDVALLVVRRDAVTRSV